MATECPAVEYTTKRPDNDAIITRLGIVGTQSARHATLSEDIKRQFLVVSMLNSRKRLPTTILFGGKLLHPFSGLHHGTTKVAVNVIEVGLI